MKDATTQKSNQDVLDELRISIPMELDPGAFTPVTSTWSFAACSEDGYARRVRAYNRAARIIRQVTDLMDGEYAAAFAGKVASA